MNKRQKSPSFLKAAFLNKIAKKQLYEGASKHNNSKERWRWHGCGGSKHLGCMYSFFACIDSFSNCWQMGGCLLGYYLELYDVVQTRLAHICTFK